MRTLKYLFSILRDVLSVWAGDLSGNWTTKDHIAGVCLILFLFVVFFVSMFIVAKFGPGVGIDTKNKFELTLFSMIAWIFLLALSCGLIIVGELVFT